MQYVRVLIQCISHVLEWFTKQTFNHFTFTHLLNVIEQFQFQMCSYKPYGCPCEMLNSSITCCLFFNRQAECFIKPTKTNNNENTISLYTNLAQFALLLDMIIYEGNGVCSTCIERVHMLYQNIGPPGPDSMEQNVPDIFSIWVHIVCHTGTEYYSDTSATLVLMHKFSGRSTITHNATLQYCLKSDISCSSQFSEWACLISHVGCDVVLLCRCQRPWHDQLQQSNKKCLIPPWKWAVFNGSRAHDERRNKRLPLLSARWQVFYVILPIGLSSSDTATLRQQRTPRGCKQRLHNIGFLCAQQFIAYIILIQINRVIA